MKKLNLFIVFAIFSFNSFSQIIDYKNDKLWIDVGLGRYYSNSDFEGFTSNISINLMKENLLYKIRNLNYTEFNVFWPTPDEKFNEVGLMIGKGFSGKFTHVLLSGGLGITEGTKRRKYLYTEPNGDFNIHDSRHYESDHFITPSLPIEIEVMFKPVSFIGAGVSLFGNLNFETPVYGFMCKFSIGKMR